MVAAQSKDVSFIILLAGTGISGDKLLLLQKEAIQRASNVDEETIKKSQKINSGAFEIVKNNYDSIAINKKLYDYFFNSLAENPEYNADNTSKEEFSATMVKSFNAPWMHYFVSYDPSIVLKDVQCPVLALNGSKDTQVPASVNLAAIRKGLERGKNKNVTIKELPNLNHLFQECKTGAPSE